MAVNKRRSSLFQPATQPLDPRPRTRRQWRRVGERVAGASEAAAAAGRAEGKDNGGSGSLQLRGGMVLSLSADARGCRRRRCCDALAMPRLPPASALGAAREHRGRRRAKDGQRRPARLALLPATAEPADGDDGRGSGLRCAAPAAPAAPAAHEICLQDRRDQVRTDPRHFAGIFFAFPAINLNSSPLQIFFYN